MNQAFQKLIHKFAQFSQDILKQAPSETHTLANVLSQYSELHLPSLAPSTQEKFRARSKRWMAPLLDIPLCELSPERISKHLLAAKREYCLSVKRSTRYNFDKELEDLKKILKWWKENYDLNFQVPVTDAHFKMGILECVPQKHRLISARQLSSFFQHLKPNYRDIALTQFFCGARIGEIVGLQHHNVDLEARVLRIREVITWVAGRSVTRSVPKNGVSREVYINQTLFNIVKSWQQRRRLDCPFLFHDQGKPFRYNRINEAYNKAWRESGLVNFSGTHQLRYAAAQITRQLMGSLEAAAAVTGHQSERMVEKYSQRHTLPLNQKSLILMEEHLMELRQSKF